MADEKEIEKNADLDGAAIADQDAGAPEAVEDTESGNTIDAGVADDASPESSKEAIAGSTAQSIEEFDEDDYIDLLDSIGDFLGSTDMSTGSFHVDSTNSFSDITPYSISGDNFNNIHVPSFNSLGLKLSSSIASVIEDPNPPIIECSSKDTKSLEFLDDFLI